MLIPQYTKADFIDKISYAKRKSTAITRSNFSDDIVELVKDIADKHDLSTCVRQNNIIICNSTVILSSIAMDSLLISFDNTDDKYKLYYCHDTNKTTLKHFTKNELLDFLQSDKFDNCCLQMSVLYAKLKALCNEFCNYLTIEIM